MQCFIDDWIRQLCVQDTLKRNDVFVANLLELRRA